MAQCHIDFNSQNCMLNPKIRKLPPPHNNGPERTHSKVSSDISSFSCGLEMVKKDESTFTRDPHTRGCQYLNCRTNKTSQEQKKYATPLTPFVIRNSTDTGPHKLGFKLFHKYGAKE